MEEMLQHLEFRIQKLLQKSEHLKASNQYSQHGKQSLSEENQRLLTKQKEVVSRIEKMVLRLKTIEGL